MTRQKPGCSTFAFFCLVCSVIAYRAVGVAGQKIFIINVSVGCVVLLITSLPQTKGDIRTDNHTYSKTYTTLNQLVDSVFPLIVEKCTAYQNQSSVAMN